MSPLHDPEARIRRSTAPCMPGNALLGEHSANPCLVSGVRNVASGREPAAHRADRPVLLGFTGSVNHRCGEADGGAHEPPIDVKSYFWGISGVETAGESIRSHSGGALLSSHAFRMIENPGSG